MKKLNENTIRIKQILREIDEFLEESIVYWGEEDWAHDAAELDTNIGSGISHGHTDKHVSEKKINMTLISNGRDRGAEVDLDDGNITLPDSSCCGGVDCTSFVKDKQYSIRVKIHTKPDSKPEIRIDGTDWSLLNDKCSLRFVFEGDLTYGGRHNDCDIYWANHGDVRWHRFSSGAKIKLS